jgi:hypothetical protein
MLNIMTGVTEIDGDLLDLYCVECGRVYYKWSIKGVVGQAKVELSVPVVPCHAGGLTVGPPKIDAMTRVRRFLGVEKTKSANGGTVAFSIACVDGMIHSFTVDRGT